MKSYYFKFEGERGRNGVVGVWRELGILEEGLVGYSDCYRGI